MKLLRSLPITLTLILALMFLSLACGDEESSSSIPPIPTPVPPTPTQDSPTTTQIPPTPTAVSATPTVDSPTPTQVPTVPTAIPPTATPIPPPPTQVPPTPTPVPPTPTPVPPTPAASPTPSNESIVQAAYARFNAEREALGLTALQFYVQGDPSFISYEYTKVIGCYESVDLHESLRTPGLQAIGLTVTDNPTECAMEMKFYDVVPLATRLRVSTEVWNCFKASRNIQEANPTSCGGRLSFLGGHVRWLPETVHYTIVENSGDDSNFTNHISWIEQKLKVKVARADNAGSANLFLYLGVENLPQGCGHANGCNTFNDGGPSGRVWISRNVPPEFFAQVLKHELLHVLLPMGHMETGNYLMSAIVDDPHQTQTLSTLENNLLLLYTHPYLREGMSMEKFEEYLIIE